jgi:hypothetical protein
MLTWYSILICFWISLKIEVKKGNIKLRKKIIIIKGSASFELFHSSPSSSLDVNINSSIQYLNKILLQISKFFYALFFILSLWMIFWFFSTLSATFVDNLNLMKFNFSLTKLQIKLKFNLFTGWDLYAWCWVESWFEFPFKRGLFFCLELKLH